MDWPVQSLFRRTELQLELALSLLTTLQWRTGRDNEYVLILRLEMENLHWT
jgi:hypothetical protein